MKALVGDCFVCMWLEVEGNGVFLGKQFFCFILYTTISNRRNSIAIKMPKTRTIKMGNVFFRDTLDGSSSVCCLNFNGRRFSSFLFTIPASCIFTKLKLKE
jgi:hypothetical protein